MFSSIHRIRIIGRTLVVTAFVSSMPSLPIPTAHAAELHAEVTISIREAVAEVAAIFEKRTGHKVKSTVAAPGEIVATLQAGQQADVVVRLGMPFTIAGGLRHKLECAVGPITLRHSPRKQT